MEQFGRLLKKFRRRSVVGKVSRGSTFTQGDLATQLALIANLDYSVAAISNWERGVNGVSPLDRHVILGLLRTLLFTRGITELKEAADLLEAGNHPPLTKWEIEDLRPSWLLTEVDTPDDSAVGGGIVDASVEDSAELIGRSTTLDQLTGSLTDRDKACVLVIVGLAGVGKTVLANAIRQRVEGGLYFSKAFQVDFTASMAGKSDETITYCLNALASHFPAIELETNLSRNEQAAQLRDVLEEQHNLVIIDGLQTSEQARALCRFLPILSSKTRYMLLLRHNPRCADVQTFHLQPLNFNGMVRFVKEYANERSISAVSLLSDEQLQQLYDAVGGVPRALELAVRLLSSGLMLEDALGVLLDSEADDDGVHVIQAEYGELFGRLSSQDKHLLNSFLFVKRTGTNRNTLLEISGFDKRQWWRSYQRLAAAGLILHAAQSDWYAIHNLTAHMLLSDLNTLSENADYLALAEHALDHWITQLAKSDAHFPRLDDQRHHWFRTVTTLLLQPAVVEKVQEKLLLLSHYIYRFVRRRGFWREWLPLLRQLVHEMPLGVSAETVHLRSQLGVLLKLNQELDAADEQFEQAREQAATLGDAEMIGRTLFQIADRFVDLGEWEQAGITGQQAYQYFREAGFELGAAGCHNLFGEVAMGKGEWDSAESEFKQASAILKKLDYPRETIRAWHNLGLAQYQQSRFDQALAAYKSADALLPTPADDVRLSYKNILLRAETHIALGETELAEKLLRGVDVKMIDSGKGATTLATYYRVQAELALTIDAFDHALVHAQNSEKLWVPDHFPRQAARVLTLKTRILVASKKKKAARQDCQTALSLVERYLQFADMRLLQEQLLQLEHDLDQL